MNIVYNFKKLVLRVLDWVVSDTKNEKKDNTEPSMTFNSFTSGGMAVKGFMRDFRLISQIDPKHFSNGTDNGPSIMIGDTLINNQLASTVAESVDDENVSDEDVEVLTSESDVDDLVRRGFVNMPNRMPVAFNYRNESGHDVKKTVVIESPTGLLSPKEVFSELQVMPCPADMVNLDAKIATYTKIYDVIRVDSSRGNRETIADILQRLKNRKLYSTETAYSVFFDQFKNTSDSAINILLDKYDHLRIGPADDFIPEMPAEALNSMLDYTDMVVKMCNVKPVFYLIAPAKDFRKIGGKRQDRDPILLVQSPIGFFWQIIGAWSTEQMLSINEL